MGYPHNLLIYCGIIEKVNAGYLSGPKIDFHRDFMTKIT